MSKTLVAILTVPAALITTSILVFFFGDIWRAVPFWVAPLVSIVAFAVVMACMFTKLSKRKFGFPLMMVGLYIYLIAIVFTQN